MCKVLTVLILAAGFLAPAACWAEQKSEASKDAESDTVQTPFGPAKKNKTPPPKPAAKTKPLVKVERDGDKITFRRQTPFGEQRWTSLSSELSDVEKQLIKEVETPDAKPPEKAVASPKKDASAPPKR